MCNTLADVNVFSKLTYYNVLNVYPLVQARVLISMPFSWFIFESFFLKPTDFVSCFMILEHWYTIAIVAFIYKYGFDRSLIFMICYIYAHIYELYDKTHHRYQD